MTEQSHATVLGAAAVLAQLDSYDVDCIFASPIAVMAPIWEVLAQRQDELRVRYFRCRHEVLAVGLASGYYKMCGRGQVVMLPTALGVQNGSMALGSALQEKTPMTVLVPTTASYGDVAAVDPGPEWPDLLVDFADAVRNASNVVKWSGRARTAPELLHQIRRACFFARSAPAGPTLVELPLDLLMADLGDIELPVWTDPPVVVATVDATKRVADTLSQARAPLIITEHAGRTPQGRGALRRIAEALNAPVFETMLPACSNISRAHPLHAAGPLEPALDEADAILVVGCNAPWHPPTRPLPAGCAVIHLNDDPLRSRAETWNFPATQVVAGDLSHNLHALAEAVEAQTGAACDATPWWNPNRQGVEAETARQNRDMLKAEYDRVAAVDLFAELRDALPDDAVCVDEIIAQIPHLLQFLYQEKPLTQVRGNAGRLGTGLATALGAKLAAPERLVVCIIGDGAWHYNPVPAALGFAQEYGVPLLIVLCNNHGYASQTWNIQKYYPHGAAVSNSNFTGDVIHPAPNYVGQAQAYGGTGERIHERTELAPALQRAVKAVSGGTTYLLDVSVAP